MTTGGDILLGCLVYAILGCLLYVILSETKDLPLGYPMSSECLPPHVIPRRLRHVLLRLSVYVILSETKDLSVTKGSSRDKKAYPPFLCGKGGFFH